MRIITFELFAVLGLAIGCALLPALWRARRSLSQLFFFSLFWGYLLLVVKLTLFPIYIDPARADAQLWQFQFNVNLLPLDFSAYFSLRAALREAMLNTLMTIPFGILVPFDYAGTRLARAGTGGSLWVGLRGCPTGHLVDGRLSLPRAGCE